MNQAEQTEIITLLKETNEYLKTQNENQQKQIEHLTQTIINLNETIGQLKRKMFGTSSEKLKANNKDIPGQVNFFNEAEVIADSSLEEPSLETVVDGYIRNGKKKKSTREEILKHLPVVEILCSVPDEDRTCSYCATDMTPLGKKLVREELRITPAKVERIQYIQEVLICPRCKDDDEPVIIQAETPSPLMKHSLASPSTVAYVMYQKYAMALPLYRQEQDWKQMGVRLPRATLANWVIRCSLDHMKPVYDRLHEHLVKRDVIHADEVPCQVLKEEGKKATSKSYMWIYTSGDDGLPAIALYEYQPGRKGDYAKTFLSGFSGFIHCDGYSGYNKLEDVVRVGCFAHCRRYFFEAIPSGKSETSAKTPGEIGYDYCNQLFLLERQFKDLSAEKRKEARLEQEVPVLKAFWNWIETLNPTSGSRLAKAVTYAKNQRKNLDNYLLDGRCALSNNTAERKAKAYVIGRKNFLFHDTVKGAMASSIIYSIVETAKANNLNVYQYLYTILLYMPDYKNESEGIEELMPWSDMIQQRCSMDNQK